MPREWAFMQKRCKTRERVSETQDQTKFEQSPLTSALRDSKGYGKANGSWSALIMPAEDLEAISLLILLLKPSPDNNNNPKVCKGRGNMGGRWTRCIKEHLSPILGSTVHLFETKHQINASLCVPWDVKLDLGEIYKVD